jgi:hypothetical protein
LWIISLLGHRGYRYGSLAATAENIENYAARAAGNESIPYLHQSKAAGPVVVFGDLSLRLHAVNLVIIQKTVI